jgi:hypothetical protein
MNGSLKITKSVVVLLWGAGKQYLWTTLVSIYHLEYIH